MWQALVKKSKLLRFHTGKAVSLLAEDILVCKQLSVRNIPKLINMWCLRFEVFTAVNMGNAGPAEEHSNLKRDGQRPAKDLNPHNSWYEILMPSPILRVLILHTPQANYTD
jgi:hypothetical protein